MSKDYANATIVKYQGDPRLFLQGDGSFLEWRGGQCIMDQGLENIVVILLFTTLEPKTSPLGWYGNYLVQEINQRIGSDYEYWAGQAITLTSINNTRAAAEKALERLITMKLAKEITVTVTNPSYNRVSTSVYIKRPDLTDQELLLTKNGENWIYQTSDPAHGRL